MTRTYYVHEDADTGTPTGPLAKHLGTPKYGYRLMKVAIRHCPIGSVVVERHEDGCHDWSGRLVYVNEREHDSK
jgi:hypothetical protein